MNTTRKSGPAPIRADDPRLLAFEAGEQTEETKAAIAAHRAKYVQARERREREPIQHHANGTVTVTESDGFVVIRPARDANRFSGDAPSGLMPLLDGEGS